MARTRITIAALSACGLLACSARPFAPAPTPPDPETVLSTEDTITGMVADGDAIDVSSYAKNTFPLAARIVRLEGTATTTLVDDARPREPILPHDGVVDYVARADDFGPYQVRRWHPDGTRETLWETNDVPTLEADGFFYGVSPRASPATQLWRAPNHGPYDLEIVAQWEQPDAIDDVAVAGSSAWIGLDDCGDGFLELGDPPCTARIERIDLTHPGSPEIAVSAGTTVEGTRIRSLQVSGTRLVYLLGRRVWLHDMASGPSGALEEDIDALYGIHGGAAIALRRHDDLRGEIVSIPLDASPTTLVAEVPPLGPLSALGDDALFLTDEDSHAVYRVQLP